MENERGIFEQGISGVELADVAPFQRQPRIVAVMGEIGLAAADQIVDHPHAIAAGHQLIDHVAADKTGAAGDDRNTLTH